MYYILLKNIANSNGRTNATINIFVLSFIFIIVVPPSKFNYFDFLNVFASRSRLHITFAVYLKFLRSVSVEKFGRMK